MVKKPVVVLDTNVTLSALLWKGKTRAIFELVEKKKIRLITSKSLLEELVRVLDYHKFNKEILSTGLTKNKIIERFLLLVDHIEEEDYPCSRILGQLHC